MTTKKCIVVTGGTRGIGEAISLELARNGYKILALFSRNREAADALSTKASSENLDIECIRGDLTHPEKFAQVVQEIRAKAPSLHGIVHCAASGVHRPAMELSLKHLKWTFEINVFAIHQLIQSLIDIIPSGGRLVAITSSGGTRVIPYYAAVGASKGAMEALFRHYASELAPKGIAVNLVCPGLVLTDAVESFPDKDQRVDRTTSATPSGQLTTPQDVAEAVKFLCSPSAAQIVGQTITIDGGKTLSS